MRGSHRDRPSQRRRTYGWLAARWPSRTGELADRLNGLPKYVVSGTLQEPEWGPARVLPGVDKVARLRRELDGEILVPGSLRLVQALLEADLVDEVRLKVFPVVLGSGRRLFGDAAAARPLQLVGAHDLGEGVAALTYRRDPKA